MKPYYTKQVLFEATRAEIVMIRVAISCWLIKHNDWKKSIPEDQEFHNKMYKLYLDATEVLNALPF